MILLIATMAAIVGVPTTSMASSRARANDPRAERDQVRSQKAAVAAQVDALEADQADVAAALTAINEHVNGKQAAYNDAERAASDAQDRADDATAAVTAKETEVADLRHSIAEFSVEAYVNPPSEEVIDGFREDSAGEATLKKSLLAFRSGSDSDLLDALRSAESELDAIRDDAEAARAEADSRLAEVAAQLAELQAAQAEQQAFANEVERRLDDRLAEATSLEATDSALSAEIAKQEEAIAAQLRAMPQPPSGAGGPISVPAPPGLVTIGGITVNESIASNLQGLLSAAAADGITLTGTGYRSMERQIELRRAHCGSSDYAVYQMSPSQCRPATARPGQSNHERGLAIDFNFSAGSTEHNWMRANGGTYGWLPLAGEHWHWSVGGG